MAREVENRLASRMPLVHDGSKAAVSAYLNNCPFAGPPQAACRRVRPEHIQTISGQIFDWSAATPAGRVAAPSPSTQFGSVPMP